MSSIPGSIPTPASYAAPRDDVLLRKVAGFGFILCIIAFWMLRHPYEGLVHDSILYAFSALARLHPESLAHDIFLSVGVQDRYTLFSPLASTLIHLMGLEPAAALITLTAQIAFFGCAWLLARQLMSPAEALLSVALLVVLPSIYGDAHIFSYAESFMTPRLPAEAFVLAALTAVLRERYGFAAACLAAAALLHPIMAAAGVAMLFILRVGLRRPVVASAIAATGLAALIAVAWLAPFGPIARFDTGWFDLLFSRGTYLFPSRWRPIDWAHASVPLTVLAVGAMTAPPSRLRSLCIAALILGLSGLGISLLGSDLLHVVIVAQAQPWRWLWLSNAMAVVLMPAVLKNCWAADSSQRSAAILLVAAWVCIDEVYAPAIGLLAILAVTSARYVDAPHRGRLMVVGAWIVLIFGSLVLSEYVLRVMKQVSLIPPDSTLYDSRYLLWLRHWKPWQAGGVLPSAVLFGVWWMAMRRRTPPTVLAVATIGIMLCAAVVPLARNAWTRVDLPASLRTEFSSWREIIPPQAQVLWARSAFPTWFLLERPSYWSQTQTAASVFSEDMAREIARRQLVIFAIEDSTHDPRTALIGICRENPSLGYYVSTVYAGPTRYPMIENPRGTGALRLYRCADYRQ